MVAGKEGGEKGVNVLGCTCRKRLERCASCNCKINDPAAAAGNELMVKRGGRRSGWGIGLGLECRRCWLN